MLPLLLLEVVQAVVLVNSERKYDSFKKADLWLSFADEFDPHVRILICECVTEYTPLLH